MREKYCKNCEYVLTAKYQGTNNATMNICLYTDEPKIKQQKISLFQKLKRWFKK